MPILSLSGSSLPTPLGPGDSDLSLNSLQGWGRCRLSPERALGLPDSVPLHHSEPGSWATGVGTQGGCGRDTAGKAGGAPRPGPPVLAGDPRPEDQPGGVGTRGEGRAPGIKASFIEVAWTGFALPSTPPISSWVDPAEPWHPRCEQLLFCLATLLRTVRGWLPAQ